MKIPNLMPFQMEPFNGDHFIQKKFLELRDKYNIKIAIETGSCLGSTTIFLGKNFERVYTIEVNPSYFAIAKKRITESDLESVWWNLGSSETVLLSIEPKESTIYFLDAHWSNNCPLLAELESIKKISLHFPVIAIHDFKVPGEPNLGFDSTNGQDFIFEWIKPFVDKIYADCEGGYSIEYNTDSESTGAKRGIIYITPNLTN